MRNLLLSIKKLLFEVKPHLTLTPQEKSFFLFAQAVDIVNIQINLFLGILFFMLQSHLMVGYHILSTLIVMLLLYLNTCGYLRLCLFIGFFENVIHVFLLTFYIGDIGAENILLFLAFFVFYAPVISKMTSYMLIIFLALSYSLLNVYLWIYAGSYTSTLPDYFYLMVLFTAISALLTMGIIRYIFHLSYKENERHIDTTSYLISSILPNHIANNLIDKMGQDENYYITQEYKDVIIIAVNLLGVSAYTKK